MPYDSAIKLSAPSDGIDLAMGFGGLFLLAETDLILKGCSTVRVRQFLKTRDFETSLCPGGSLDLDFDDNQPVMACAA